MPLKGEREDKPSYVILRSLVGGAVAELRVAHHKVFDRVCVQKTYSTLGLEDAVAHQEPRLLYSIKHPHVCEVLEAQYDPDVTNAITFVSPFYEGGSVLDALSEGYRFSIHQAIKLTAQVLDALAYVHSDDNLRYIHRDIKQANILLDRYRQNAFLADWGSAARIESDGMVAGIQGTPLYTPPEAGPMDGRMDARGDIYSTGLSAFEMLNGAFNYATIDPITVDRRLSHGLPALPNSALVFGPHVPSSLRAIMRRSMRKKPAERYASASEFISALQHVRCIDWSHVEGQDLDGVWHGSWPPQYTPNRRRYYEVRFEVVSAAVCGASKLVRR